MSDESNNVTVLTDEEVNKLENTMEEIRSDSTTLTQTYEILNSTDDKVEEGEFKMMNVSINPQNGMQIVSSIEDNSATEESLEETFSKDINFEVDDSPITLDELKVYLTETKDDPIIQDNLDMDGITSNDFIELLDLVTQYQNNTEISSPFNKLPKAFQDAINKSMGPGYGDVYNNQVNSLRNDMAEMLLNQFVSSITMERANKSINSSIETMFNKAAGEIGDTIVGYTEDRNNKYRLYIEGNIEDPVKKAEALSILDKIDNAYKLDEFKEYCKRCKIRKIDIEHPERNDNKDIDYLLRKYDNSKNFNIYNIYNAQAVLERNININEETLKYTQAHCRAFLIAFARYCMNFNPSVTDQHIFMFYTIYNILLTDVNKGEKASVSKEFLANARDCIDNLIARNPFLK